MTYDIKLRPHHITALINFKKQKLYLLSDSEYVQRFQRKNKGYHNDRFVLYWKNFLNNLYSNQETKFLYENNFDIVCDNCDIKNDCENKESDLHKLVTKLDIKSVNILELVEGNIYKINDLMNNIS